MPDPLLYLQATAAAAIVSAVFVLALAGWRRPVGFFWLNTVCLLGISLGLALGCHLLRLHPAWPPRNGLDRLLTVVLPAVVGLELLAGSPRVSVRVAWLLRVALALMIPRILLHGSVYLSGASDSWSVWQTGLVLAACGLLLIAVWGLLSQLSRRAGGATIALAVGLTFPSAGLAIMLAGYIQGGVAALPLGGTIGATTLVVWLHACRQESDAAAYYQGLLGLGLVGLFGLMFIGCFFGRLSSAYALALLSAPLLCGVPEWLPLRPRSPWGLDLLRLAMVALVLGIVLFAAKRDFDQNMAPLLGNRSGLQIPNAA
jgi:hypothetical protein